MLTPSIRALCCAITILIASSTTAVAQKNNPLINSGEKLAEGTKKFEQKKYQDAVALYNQINRSDTNYVEALQALANTYYADSQYNKAIEYAKLGMKLFPNKFSTFNMIAANSLDNLGMVDEAQAEYDRAIAYNPHNHILHFNKGITNFNAKNNEAARTAFQQALLIDPFYSPAHFYLAGTHLRDGNLIPAMLGYATYLLISPEGSNSNNAIVILSNISKSSDDVLEMAKNKKAGSEKSFNALQDLVLSKIAIDAKYKSLVDLDDNMVKQLQAVCEKLSYKKDDKGFVMQFYVPLFVKIFQEKKFAPMIYTMFSGVDLKPIKSWNQGHKKEKDAFITLAANYLNEVKFSRILDAEERNSPSAFYVYNDNRLIAKGPYNLTKAGMEPFGNWEFFNDEGRVVLTGDFSKQSKKTGVWTSYYTNSKVKEKLTYKEGVLNGASTGWFENGNKWYDETFKDGELDGVQTIRFLNENLRSIIPYKNGKITGESKYFNVNDILTHSYTYKDGKLNGPYKTYHSNGKVKEESSFANDVESGSYKSYYETGEVFATGTVTNGKRNGLWENFFKNGKIKAKSVYVDGEVTGEFSEYFENGNISVVGGYVKKKLDGKVNYFDKDGVKYYETVYDKGRLREITHYDKKGNVIQSSTTRKGAGLITFYSPNGNKKSEGFFDKEGQKQGKYEEYFSGGKLSEVSEWKDGEMHGNYVSYLPSGVKVYESTYKNGQEDGYVKAYFTNGKIKKEGWMVDGQKQQTWIYYTLAGDLYLKEFYRDNELNGFSEYFYPGGKLDYEYKYLSGWVQEVTQFDTLGKVIQENKFENGSGKLIFKFFDGKVLSEGNYSHFLLNGKKDAFFYDGSPSRKSTYKNDNLHGSYISYFYGGTVAAEGAYEDGKRIGKWKNFFGNGTLESEEEYNNGELTGTVRSYFRDGRLDKSSEYTDGELNGQVTYFGEKEEIALVLNYEEDRLMSYQYMGPDGKLVAPVPLKNYSGTIKSFYANGKPSAELTYYENNVDGPFKFYYSNGKVKWEGVKKGGYNHGEMKWYYADGKPQKIANYNLGNYHGACNLFYPDGKPEMELNYYDDEHHGINKYYDAKTGKQSIRTNYYGHIQSIR